MSNFTNVVQYQSIFIPNNGSISKLKDNSGYWISVLGAFDAYSRNNAYYPFTEQVKALFKKGSILMRRLDEGVLRGELGHPDLSKIPEERRLYRLAQIDESRTCVHFRKITIVDSFDDNKRPIKLVLGEFTPSGELADPFRAQLENPHENVCFSMRCFNEKPYFDGGVLKKHVTDITAWDVVNDPGLKVASQYETLVREALVHFSTEGLTEQNLLNFTEQDFVVAEDSFFKASRENEYKLIKSIREHQGWTTTARTRSRFLAAWGG